MYSQKQGQGTVKGTSRGLWSIQTLMGSYYYSETYLWARAVGKGLPRRNCSPRVPSLPGPPWSTGSWRTCYYSDFSLLHLSDFLLHLPLAEPNRRPEGQGAWVISLWKSVSWAIEKGRKEQRMDLGGQWRMVSTRSSKYSSNTFNDAMAIKHIEKPRLTSEILMDHSLNWLFRLGSLFGYFK